MSAKLEYQSNQNFKNLKYYQNGNVTKTKNKMPQKTKMSPKLKCQQN